MKKYSFITIFSLVFLLLSACSSGKTGASSSSDQDEASNGEVEKILVTEAFHSLLYLPLYVGNQVGIFEENGLEISSIRAAGTGPTALTSVLSGESQFSVHGPEHVGFAKEKGGHAKIVSAVANSAPVWVLAKEDVTVNSPADLKGKRIVVGLAPGTSHTLLTRLLQDNGLDSKKDVTITEVQLGSELGPVLAGEADIAVAYQPQADQGIAQGLKIVHDFTKDYPDYAFSTFNTSQKLIEENPEMVGKFVKSMDQSLAFIHENPEKAKEIAQKEFPELDADVVGKAVERMIESNVYPESAKVSEEAFRAAFDMQKFVGNLKNDIKYDDIVSSEFAN